MAEIGHAPPSWPLGTKWYPTLCRLLFTSSFPAIQTFTNVKTMALVVAFFVRVSSKGLCSLKLKISDAGQNGPFSKAVHWALTVWLTMPRNQHNLSHRPILESQGKAASSFVCFVSRNASSENCENTYQTVLWKQLRVRPAWSPGFASNKKWIRKLIKISGESKQHRARPINNKQNN